MSKEFDKCIEKNKLTKFSRGYDVLQSKLKEAIQDLNDAKEGYVREKYKWTTIQSYYAMFNAGNAMLMKHGYREKNSHYCLIVGIKELYVKTGLLDISHIEAIQKGKSLREAASYHGEWSKKDCKELLDEAAEFIIIAEKILKK